MTAALLISAMLFIVAVGVHLSVLGAARSWLRQRSGTWGKLLAALFVLASHIFVAAWFGLGFWTGHELGLGGFDKADAMNWMDYFYFSLINVTTLGLGDIYPTLHLRVVAGVEALTGFLLISCSAQLFWSMMEKGNG